MMLERLMFRKMEEPKDMAVASPSFGMESGSCNEGRRKCGDVRTTYIRADERFDGPGDILDRTSSFERGQLSMEN